MDETVSIDIRSVPLHLLITRVQTLGARIDQIREERRYLKAIIAERLAAGESEHPQAEVQTIGAADVATVSAADLAGTDGTAPGAVLEASAKQG